MRSWEATLDLQLDIASWMGSEQGQRFGGGYFGSAVTDPLNAPMGLTFEQGYAKGVAWAQRLSAQVFNAEPIFVEPTMMDVVEHAVAGFRAEPLLDTDLITQSGLLVLPRPFTVHDRKGRALTWRVAHWATYRDGISLTLFHSMVDRDDFDEEWEKNGYPWLPTHVISWDWGAMHPGAGHGLQVDEPITTRRSPTELIIDNAGGDTGDFGQEASSQVHRQIQGVWRLLLQHIADVSKRRPPRAFAKRAARQGITHHVTIVKLRRPHADRDPDAEPGTVAWTHQWIVGGHWRNQWYPSISKHRQIWISPFVKGPPELPLVVNKARIFDLSR